jgi:pseudouridine-5'-phosphate glycosidase
VRRLTRGNQQHAVEGQLRGSGARKAGIIGKAVTPFLLEHFHTASEGESLSVNIEIIKYNSALAADIAVVKQR